MADSNVLKSLYRDFKSQIDPKSIQPSVTVYDREKEMMAFQKLFRDIRLQVDVGLKLHQMRRNTVDSQFHDVFTEIDLLLEPVETAQQSIFEGKRVCIHFTLYCRAPKFDFVQPDGTHVKANGFRSLLCVLKELLSCLLYYLQKYARDRGGLFYNAADSLSNITAHARALQGMERICYHANALMTVNDSPNLHNSGDMRRSLLSLLYTETVCRDAFYGRCLGFQYSQGLKPILQFLAIAMASYEDWYKGTKDDPIKQLLNSLLKGGKYIQHPTQRGVKIAELTDDCSIYFAKAFWSLTEQTAVKTAVKLVSQSVDVSETLEVPAKNVTVDSVNGGSVTLQPPFSDLGYRPISVSLISHKLRDGQPFTGYKRPPTVPPSTGLIIHFHGGGFVAQSSKSHEFYLRWWSKELDCPILSVDYSLAPEAPYPRAVDECIFVYAWALNNLAFLGTTGERIILAGDSAGGYFSIVTAMKAKQLKLRLPDQVFAYYPATLISSAVSPSRFLSLMDPLLPIGILLSCLQAYTGCLASEEVQKRRKEIRDKILAAKGYVIPSTCDPYVAPKPQTRWDKMKGGFQRSQTTPEVPSAPKDSKAAPPARPPPPKSTRNASVGSKPSRPPPPSLKNGGKAVSMSVGSESPSVLFKPSAAKLEEHEEEENEVFESKDEKTSSIETGQSETQESCKEEGEEKESEGDEQGLTEVDLKAEQQSDSNCTGQAETQEDHRQSITSSASPFFPKHKSPGLRFGMKVPSKEETLSEEEIEALIEEVMATFDDADITLKDPFISPVNSPDELLKGLPLINIIVCSLDPLLDDGIMMAQRLKSLDQPVTLTVMENLSHGYLSLTGTEQLNAAYAKSIAMMKQALMVGVQQENNSEKES
uniref:Hormone-sensitive lipase n=1 Tax=Amphimedon queenslandica TaxID=400682 RepID=A0A1X7TZZ6_AMPQE